MASMEETLCLTTLEQDAFWHVNKALIRNLGLIEANILTYLVDLYAYYKRQNQLREDGSFYIENAQMQNDLHLSDFLRRDYIARLKQLHLIDTTRKGIPPRVHYTINFKRLAELLKKDGVTLDSKAVKVKRSHSKFVDGQRINLLHVQQIQQNQEVTSSQFVDRQQIDLDHVQRIDSLHVQRNINKEDQEQNNKNRKKECDASVTTHTPPAKTAKKTKPTTRTVDDLIAGKKPYGEFQHVYLSDTEYGKLVTTCQNNEREVKFWIADVDDYLENHPSLQLGASKDAYVNHYATIRTWRRRDIDKYKKFIASRSPQPTKPKYQPVPANDAAAFGISQEHAAAAKATYQRILAQAAQGA